VFFVCHYEQERTLGDTKFSIMQCRNL